MKAIFGLFLNDGDERTTEQDEVGGQEWLLGSVANLSRKQPENAEPRGEWISSCVWREPTARTRPFFYVFFCIYSHVFP